MAFDNGSWKQQWQHIQQPLPKIYFLSFILYTYYIEINTGKTIKVTLI